MYYDAKKHFEAHGVVADNVRIDLPKMMAQKDKSVQGLTQGIEGLFKKNKARSVPFLCIVPEVLGERTFETCVGGCR